MKKKLLVVLSLLSLLVLPAYLLDNQDRMPWIKVEENKFVTEDREATIVFQGYSSSDPDKLANENLWNKSYFREMKNWGANVVRVPVHPTAWNRRGPSGYEKLLDQAISWAGKNNMYVIIDWHSIGNVKDEKFHLDMYETTMEETLEFWKRIAKRYGNNPTVAFYELFNEPTTNNSKYGELTWEEWRTFNEKMIDVIRENGGKGIPLVAGFNWAYDLTNIRNAPVQREGIGYVSHPYPQKRPKPWEEHWNEDWGFAKEKYPIILTEIGFCGADDIGAHVPVISDESYGDEITEYCDRNGISYVVWVFDKTWTPSLYVDDKYTPSRQGEYFKKKIRSYRN